MMRIGHGFDVHAFREGDHIVLGGVRIAHDKAFAAHSDGDVLIHALCDALLGALALGDLGTHFPDTSPEFENIDSRVLLRQVVNMLNQRGWRVVNADNSIIAQAPRVASYIAAMRANLAGDLLISTGQVSVKATTTEHLGYLGRGEGIAVHSVVLLATRKL